MGGARLPRLDMTPPQAARTLQRITDSLHAVTLAARPGGGHGTLGSISCQTPHLWPFRLGVPLLAVSVEAGMFGKQDLYSLSAGLNLGGLAGGLLVPALGRRDGVGLLVSLGAALLGGLLFAAAGYRLAR
jgi:hypothetical protein